MPTYLLTFHAYGTWMPDRREGSFHWKRGYQPQSEGLGKAYRARQTQPAARFDEGVQRIIIQSMLETCGHKRLVIHAIATDDTHLHTLCEWNDGRTAIQVQDRLKHALTQGLNQRIERRRWFTKGGHRKAVDDVEHYDYLCDEYLPAHRGLRWDVRRGWC